MIKINGFGKYTLYLQSKKKAKKNKEWVREIIRNRNKESVSPQAPNTWQLCVIIDYTLLDCSRACNTPWNMLQEF